MKTPIPRGLAVLALLCLLPRVSAVPISTVTLLTDNRSNTISGTLDGNAVAGNQSPSAPFAPFNNTLSGGAASGVTVVQNSVVAPGVIQSFGYYVADWQAHGPAGSVHMAGSSNFVVSFSVSDPTPFSFYAYAERNGFLGVAGVSLTGVGGTNTNILGLPYNMSFGPITGILQPGVYTLTATETVTIDREGTFPPIDGGNGRYIAQLTLGVPDGTASAMLLGLGVIGICALHRRRNWSRPAL